MQSYFFIKVLSFSKKELKKIFFLLATFFLFFIASSQVSVMKIVGKNADGYKLGAGIFYFFDIPVNPIENNSIICEFVDFGNFFAKDNFGKEPAAYVSFKAGFRHIFSTEGKTGFFIEPQAGYCRATSDKFYSIRQGGLALAMFAGYSQEVGYNGNTLVFGLKYETDLPGSNKQINTIGLRFAFNYNLKAK